MILTRRRALHALGGVAAAVLALSTSAMAQDTLNIAVYPSNPPWQNQIEAGGFEGFEVDIVNEVASRMGREAAFAPTDFRAIFVATASGRADMAISSITITDERLQTQSFTQPYVRGGLGVGIHEGDAVTALEDLRGKTVGAIATSFGEGYITERSEALGIGELRSYDTLANMLSDLANGRLDAVINDVVGLQYAFTQMDGLAVATEIDTGELFAIMMPKDSPLLEEVNDHISDMKSDGTMAELYEKWFGVAPSPDSVTITPMPVPATAAG